MHLYKYTIISTGSAIYVLAQNAVLAEVALRRNGIPAHDIQFVRNVTRGA